MCVGSPGLESPESQRGQENHPLQRYPRSCVCVCVFVCVCIHMRVILRRAEDGGDEGDEGGEREREREKETD